MLRILKAVQIHKFTQLDSVSSPDSHTVIKRKSKLFLIDNESTPLKQKVVKSLPVRLKLNLRGML